MLRTSIARLAAVAAIVGTAVSHGYGPRLRTHHSTQQFKPRSNEEDEAALAKAEAKRQRKAVKRLQYARPKA